MRPMLVIITICILTALTGCEGAGPAGIGSSGFSGGSGSGIGSSGFSGGSGSGIGGFTGGGSSDSGSGGSSGIPHSPEPATLALFGAGLAGLALLCRKKK